MPYLITDKCNGCDSCLYVCPTGAISGKQYLQHVIDPDLCVSCGLCSELCENEAILDNFGRPTKMKPRELWKTPIIDRKTCVGCSLCVEACPMYVLEISGPRFHGDTHTFAKVVKPNMCIGCEKCSKRCPVNAISMIERGPEDNEFWD